MHTYISNMMTISRLPLNTENAHRSKPALAKKHILKDFCLKFRIKGPQVNMTKLGQLKGAAM